MANEPTVFVIDDDAAVRDSLRALLESVGLRARTYPSPDEFLAEYAPSQPGCLILDIRMPGASGIALQQRLAELRPQIPIIFVTGYADVPTAVRAMKLGAMDFLEKPFSEESLLDRVRHAIETDAHNRVDHERRAAASAKVQRLSPREREVLGLMVAGRRTKQIAAELFRTEKTIEFHRRNVMRKMGVATLAELVRVAEVAGVTPGIH